MKVPPGSSVSFTAAPADGSSFATWSDACSGTGACVVSARADASVGARFDLKGHPPPDGTRDELSLRAFGTPGELLSERLQVWQALGRPLDSWLSASLKFPAPPTSTSTRLSMDPSCE